MATTDTLQQDTRAARFAAFARQAEDTEPAWLREARRAAFERFRALGFPTARDEAWRHTDAARIARTRFDAAPVAALDPPALRGALVLEDPESPILVFVNGRLAPAASRLAGLPGGARVLGLADALASDPAFLEAHLGRTAASDAHPFTALNAAFVEDGAVVHLRPGTVVEHPIQLVFLAGTAGGAGAPFETHPRVLVVAEEGSQAVIVESFAGEGMYLANAVSEVILGAGAVLAHVKVQRESTAGFHVGRTRAALGRGAGYSSTSLALGSALARNEVDVVFGGEGGSCALFGLYAVAGAQHTDNQTFVDHARPRCSSQQLYKGVLAGKARGVFNGRVVVRKDAQGTDAHQTNRNLLLTEEALVDTKPQLEIHADDVRCTHGATIGRLADDEVFYLRARGIGLEAARDILTRAFARETVARVRPEALRQALEAIVEEQLASFAAAPDAAATAPGGTAR